MKNDIKLECSICHLKKPKREVKRIGNELRCNDCQIERRKNHREFLKRDVLGIRKREDLVKEWQQKREQRQLIPKIRGSRDMGRIKGRHYYSGLWLTNLEKEIIYKKYSALGYGSDWIHKRYGKIRGILEKQIVQWKEQEKTDEEINTRFKEEFSKFIIED